MRYHDRIFERRILSSYNLATAQPAIRPTVLFLAGQPGAGKSQAQDALRAQFGLDGDGIAVIDADDFRRFDPIYRRMIRIDPRAAATARQPVAAYWADKAMWHAAASRWSAVISCTLGTLTSAQDRVGRFLDSGYRVIVAMAATHEALSRIGILRRFYDALHDPSAAPRFVPADVHNECYRGLLATAHWLGEAASRDPRLEVLLWYRRGSARQVHADASAQLLAAREHPLEREDIRDFGSDATVVDEGLSKSPADQERLIDFAELAALTRTLVTPEGCVPRHANRQSRGGHNTSDKTSDD